MEKTKVRTLIRQVRGVSYKPEDLHNELDDNSVILLRANNIDEGKINFDDVVYVDKSKVSDEQYLKDGDILICASSGSKNLVGKAASIRLNMECTFGAFCKVVRPKEGIEEYLGVYFQSPIYRRKISEVAIGANINNIRNEHIDELDIPVFSNDEQVSIAKRMHLIQEVISNRKAELEKLDDLIKARFVEMFGDSVLNEKGWKTKPLLDMGKCKNGMNFHYDDSGVEINCLGVGDFKDLSVIDNTEQLPTVSLNEMPSEEYLLKDDDIVFVRSNGNKALVGRSVAVYPGDIPTTFSGFCIRYRKYDNAVTIPYLLRVLKADSIRKKMAGRGANIQNLNQQILGTLIIPVPPIELQMEFSDFVKQVDKSKVVVQKALDETQILFNSLMQQYFG
jgi:type I restriction enzyme S subunit